MNKTSSKFSQLVSPPVFIVGAARSGTTWVHDIFKAHPEVATAYETFLFTNNGIAALFSEMHRKETHGMGRLFKSEAEYISTIRQFVEDILSNVIEPQHKFFVEKSPNHIYSTDMIRKIFPDAKFIHLLRDGRDVYVSVRAATKSWMPNWKETFGRSVRSHAKAWSDEVQRSETVKGQLGDDFIHIRYEELHDDPRASYRKLFDFAQIPYDDNLLEQIFQQTDFQSNYRGGESKFRRGGRTQDWKQQMTLWEALQFNHKAGQVLIDLGYESDRMWFPRRIF